MKKTVVLLAVVFLSFSVYSNAAVIETIDVDNEGTAYDYVPTTSAAGQWFTVPTGQTCTSVSMKALLGGAWSVYPAHTVIFRLKDADGIWHTSTVAAGDFGADGAHWMLLDNLNLGAGSYLAQILTTSSSLDPSLRVYKEATPSVPDYYSDGYAATGWSGETAVGDGVDYLMEITLIPEPATMAIFGLGGLLLARKRK